MQREAAPSIAECPLLFAMSQSISEASARKPRILRNVETWLASGTDKQLLRTRVQKDGLARGTASFHMTMQYRIVAAHALERVL